MICFDERELRLSFLPKWKKKSLIRRENGKRNVRWEVLVKS